ncbi:MAG: hypothetical protein ACRDP6_46600 [Actinoallomurus sp.]
MRPAAPYTIEDVRSRTYKARDAWWTVLLVDPLAGRLVRFVANRTSLTPNQLSAAALALTIGKFSATERPVYLYLGVAIVFLDMLRYLDALKVAAARREMRGRLRDARGPAVEEPEEETPAADLQEGLRKRFAWYLRVRDGLARRRVRTHLVGGIEFQMAVFIIGPLCHAIIPVTIVAAALMLFFEAGIIYKLWLSSRDLTRLLGEIETARSPA